MPQTLNVVGGMTGILASGLLIHIEIGLAQSRYSEQVLSTLPERRVGEHRPLSTSYEVNAPRSMQFFIPHIILASGPLKRRVTCIRRRGQGGKESRSKQRGIKWLRVHVHTYSPRRNIKPALELFNP